MADLVLLPTTTYRPPSPAGRGKGRSLNTIIEEEGEYSPSIQVVEDRRRMNSKSTDKIEHWLSPLSDHFPTPRGFHFLAAPIVPSSPSANDADEDETSSETSSSNPSTNMWNRESVGTDVTDFDDIYDLSDDEEARKERNRANSRLSRRHSSRKATRPSSKAPHAESRKALPPLIIPSAGDCGTETWSARSGLKKLTSPVPPTPPAQVQMSPAIKSFMETQQALAVPTISAPPSLDGSLSSDQLAALSAPPTPVIGTLSEAGEDWTGVQLQPGAFATLQALSGGDEEFEQPPEQVIEVPREEMSEMRQQLPRLMTGFQRAPVAMSPNQHRSFAGLTRLDIPSPGGFFSDLSPRTRHTWHLPGTTSGDEVAPPTSTTAEQFYRTPWSNEQRPPLPPPPPRALHMSQGDYSSSPVEQFAEMVESTAGDPPTAIRVEPTPPANALHRASPAALPSNSSVTLAEPSSPVDATEIVRDPNPEYARKQQEVALSHLDRTEMWLTAQRAYLNGILTPEDPQGEEERKESDEPEEEKAVAEEPAPVAPEIAASALQRKKTVRFSDVVKTADVPRSLPSKLVRLESAYYRAFQDYIIRSQRSDVFIHRLPRFEALQAQRVSLREMHRNQLLGKHQLSVMPQSAKKRMSANVARGDDVLLDDPEKIKAEKEHEALSQMAMATWHVAATRLLNGGRLIAAPVAKRLARQSRMAPGADGVARDRARILDLGGQGSCDWAWHAALQYPNTKIYTVTTKAIRQLSNANIRGPPNHRQVAVDRLTRLPFADGQFDLVSARELHGILKFVGENGEDEWEACLRECLRVLKPGGYLEFSVLDSEIMNAGPRALAKSVEFGFALKTLGYDPNPTRLFLSRLARAGFESVRRAWLCLPVGPQPAAARRAAENIDKPLPNPSADSATAPGQTVRLEAMVTGSADGVAAVTGLAAGWSWERWLLRCAMERAAGELRLADTVTAGDAMREADKALDGVHAVIEEGRARGSGWRLLRGYARKPRHSGVINISLDC